MVAMGYFCVGSCIINRNPVFDKLCLYGRIKIRKTNTAFSASDFLSFYGTVISSSMTIVALIATIRFTAYQNLQEQKRQRNTLLADYSKAEIIRKSDEMMQYAEKIKELYLLEMLNDTGNGFGRLFKPSGTNLFVSAFTELQYWISRLNLSENTAEKEFRGLIKEFIDNTKEAYRVAGEELESIYDYQKEYSEKKKQFENAKHDYLQDHPTYDIEARMQSITKRPKKPPYGTFEMAEPESESTVTTKLIKHLKTYRDDHRDSFICAYDALVDYQRKKLSEEIAKLYDFDDKLNKNQP